MKEKLSAQALISQVKTKIEVQARVFDSRGEISNRMTVHIPYVVEWAEFLCQNHPEANRNLVILGTWLHDCGYLWDGYKIGEDHAVSSEKRGKEILEELGADQETIKPVLKIIRRHRNKDVKPETIEEIIVATADSAAHFSENIHLAILYDKEKDFGIPREKVAADKLERDWRDVQVFPELAQKLKGQYEAIKTELLAFSSPR